jgi:hypothetical protein
MARKAANPEEIKSNAFRDVRAERRCRTATSNDVASNSGCRLSEKTRKGRTKSRETKGAETQ